MQAGRLCCNKFHQPAQRVPKNFPGFLSIIAFTGFIRLIGYPIHPAGTIPDQAGWLVSRHRARQRDKVGERKPMKHSPKFFLYLTFILTVFLFPSAVSHAQWDPRMDFNNDGIVDAMDLALFLMAWHTQAPVPVPTPTFVPDPRFAGIWIGTYQMTHLTNVPKEYGYIIFQINSNGQDLEMIDMTHRGERYLGSITGNSLQASDVSATPDSAIIKGVWANNTITGTYESPSSKGTFTLKRPGVRADLGGVWILSWKDEYREDKMLTHGVHLAEITQSGNQISVKTPDNTDSLTGYVEGDTFTFSFPPAEAENDFFVGGVVSGNSISGTYAWENDRTEGWSSYTGTKYNPSTLTANIAGKWTITSQDIYPAKALRPSVFTITMTQNKNDITLSRVNDEGRIITFNGKIYGTTFVLAGTETEGSWNRVDGTITGNTISGTFEGSDPSEWWWGTYTGKR